MDGVKQGVGTDTMGRALTAFREGANLTYFCKRSNYVAYSQQEGKRTFLRAFPVLAWAQWGEKEPILGLFPYGFFPLFLKAFDGEKWGYPLSV